MNSKTVINLILALALVLPATMFTAMSTATAGPGSVLKSANKDGKRTHKRANAKRTKKKSKSKSKRKRSSTTRRKADSRRTVRRTTTHRSRPSTTRRTTTRTRTVRTPHRTQRRVTRTSPRHRHTTRRTRTRHVQHNHSRTRTRVVHTRSSSSTRANTHASSSSSGSSIEAYITGGLGYSGFAAPTITDDALPGAGYNVALGLKGDYLGFEFGFNGSGHTFDPEAATTDLAVFGLSGDLKLQPSIAFFEPYVLVGMGGYSLQDGVINEASGGIALRLGAGADFRFDDAALGVRYLHSTYGFADDSGIYGGDFGASSETLGINLSFYF